MTKQTKKQHPRRRKKRVVVVNLHDNTENSQPLSYFALRLDYCLFARGMNNTDLAGGIGVSESTVRNWLASKAEPSISQLKKIAGVLQVPVLWLLEDAAPLADTASALPDDGEVRWPGWQTMADPSAWLALGVELSLNNVSPADALALIREAFAKTRNAASDF